jgi:hypothetical protein
LFADPDVEYPVRVAPRRQGERVRRYVGEYDGGTRIVLE